MSGRRLTSRDFKGAQRRPLDLTRWRELGLGLAAGLLVALVVFVHDRRAEPGAVDPAPVPRSARAHAAPSADATDVPAAASPAGSASKATGDETDFAFYRMLPKFEVVVPEKERTARIDAASRVERPGTYFLQVGSYRAVEEAERVRAQLARQGIAANVQRVSVDTDVWHRVRVGPIKDLSQLNRLRRQLQSADLDSLVIRVEE